MYKPQWSPGSEAREAVDDSADPVALLRAAMEPGLRGPGGLHHPVGHVAARAAAMEPGLRGPGGGLSEADPDFYAVKPQWSPGSEAREARDPNGPGVFMDTPQWSPGSEAREAVPTGWTRADGASPQWSPGSEAREAQPTLVAVNVISTKPQWSPGSEAREASGGSITFGGLRVAAMEPGLRGPGGRPAVAAQRRPWDAAMEPGLRGPGGMIYACGLRRAPPGRNGARAQRPGRPVQPR